MNSELNSSKYAKSQLIITSLKIDKMFLCAAAVAVDALHIYMRCEHTYLY